MSEYNNIITPSGVEKVEITGSELTQLEADRAAFAAKVGERKLETIKQIRLDRLKETDWWVSRGNMTAAQSEWRQSLRDIPINHTTEEAYDLLLAREKDKTKDNFRKLTHPIWSKP